jgi:hypothetical protein
MKILALDVATKMGAAFGRPSSSPVTWTVGFDDLREHDARFSKAIRFMQEMHKQLAPDLVAVEAAVGGRDANAYLIGLVAVLRGAACNLGMRTVQYQIGSIRKHFLGRHFTKADFPHLSETAATKMIKGKVLQRCRALGWQINDHDQADAASLWSYACAIESRQHVAIDTGPLFDGRPL